MIPDTRRTRPSPRAALAAALALALATPLAAQNDFGGRGAFQAGWQTPDLDGLNASLAGAGFPTFDDGFLTLGGFGLWGAGDVLLGFEGHGFLPREEDTADGTYRTRLTGGYGMFNLGWLAWSDDRLDVYPIFGVGGGAMQLDLIERTSPLFDDVLDDPARSSRLASETWLLSAAVGADWRFGGGDDDRRERARRDRDDDEDDDGRGGLFLGVRTGWVWAPGDVNWELDELNDVAGGPETAPTGFFVRLSIGGWGSD